MNYTIIFLIPKVNVTNSFSNFFPISLYNFIYKIMLKVLVHHLKSILSIIISPNQGGFVQGHQILDGIITIHEISHYVAKYGKDGMFLNLDVNNAYDRVD